jgi:hypothetical protein
LDIQIDYEKTPNGARVRVRNVKDAATPTDSSAPEREGGPSDFDIERPSSAPSLKEFTHDVPGGGTVTVSVHPSQMPAATAAGDTGSAANNSTVGYIQKRTNALIANEFAAVYSVINLGLTFQFQIGVT